MTSVATLSRDGQNGKKLPCQRSRHWAYQVDQPCSPVKDSSLMDGGLARKKFKDLKGGQQLEASQEVLARLTSTSRIDTFRCALLPGVEHGLGPGYFL